jgi:hypothetical protein
MNAESQKSNEDLTYLDAEYKLRVEDRGSTVEDRGSTVEDRGSTVEDQGSAV